MRLAQPVHGQQVIVRINDRGPYSGGRVIDLSKAAAEDIGMITDGTTYILGEILQN